MKPQHETRVLPPGLAAEIADIQKEIALDISNKEIWEKKYQKYYKARLVAIVQASNPLFIATPLDSFFAALRTRKDWGTLKALAMGWELQGTDNVNNEPSRDIKRKREEPESNTNAMSSCSEENVLKSGHFMKRRKKDDQLYSPNAAINSQGAGTEVNRGVSPRNELERQAFAQGEEPYSAGYPHDTLLEDVIAPKGDRNTLDEGVGSSPSESTQQSQHSNNNHPKAVGNPMAQHTELETATSASKCVLSQQAGRSEGGRECDQAASVTDKADRETQEFADSPGNEVYEREGKGRCEECVSRNKRCYEVLEQGGKTSTKRVCVRCGIAKRKCYMPQPRLYDQISKLLLEQHVTTGSIGSLKASLLSELPTKATVEALQGTIHNLETKVGHLSDEISTLQRNQSEFIARLREQDHIVPLGGTEARTSASRSPLAMRNLPVDHAEFGHADAPFEPSPPAPGISAHEPSLGLDWEIDETTMSGLPILGSPGDALASASNSKSPLSDDGEPFEPPSPRSDIRSHVRRPSPSTTCQAQDSSPKFLSLRKGNSTPQPAGADHSVSGNEILFEPQLPTYTRDAHPWTTAPSSASSPPTVYSQPRVENKSLPFEPRRGNHRNNLRRSATTRISDEDVPMEPPSPKSNRGRATSPCHTSSTSATNSHPPVDSKPFRTRPSHGKHPTNPQRSATSKSRVSNNDIPFEPPSPKSNLGQAPLPSLSPYPAMTNSQGSHTKRSAKAKPQGNRPGKTSKPLYSRTQLEYSTMTSPSSSSSSG